MAKTKKTPLTKIQMMDKIQKKLGKTSREAKQFCQLCVQNLVSVEDLRDFYFPKFMGEGESK